MRYQSLDVWRALACLAVVACHSVGGREPSVFHWGWLGVPVFFVISGYCISAAVEKSTNFRTYLRRRVRRIYPPYWAALAVAALGSFSWHLTTGAHPLPRATDLSAAQWLGNLTLTESWRPYLLGGPMLGLLTISWTLCYEEQFYLIAGLLRRWFFPGVALVTIGVLAWRWPLSGCFFDGLWLHFAAGVLVYFALHRDRRAALLLIPAAFWLYGPTTFCQNRPHSFDQLSVVAFSFAMLLFLLKPLDAWLAWRPLAAIGKFSYSIYLIHPLSAKLISDHLPGPAWLAALVGIAAGIATGYLFYRAVEARCLPATH
jgi:peptidoglycan/LPS O-acetylase OafA/YrhL